MASPDKIEAALQVFRGRYLPDAESRPIPAESLADAPPAIAALLASDGVRSYAGQMLWTCDPAEWQQASRAWLPGRARADAYLRTAFGDLFIWDGANFWFAMVHDGIVVRSVSNDVWFLSETLGPEGVPSLRKSLPKRVAKARASRGPLEPGQIYAYVPALALGGDENTSAIERVPAQEHLVMLARLGIEER